MKAYTVAALAVLALAGCGSPHASTSTSQAPAPTGAGSSSSGPDGCRWLSPLEVSHATGGFVVKSFQPEGFGTIEKSHADQRCAYVLDTSHMKGDTAPGLGDETTLYIDTWNDPARADPDMADDCGAGSSGRQPISGVDGYKCSFRALVRVGSQAVELHVMGAGDRASTIEAHEPALAQAIASKAS